MTTHNQSLMDKAWDEVRSRWGDSFNMLWSDEADKLWGNTFPLLPNAARGICRNEAFMIYLDLKREEKVVTPIKKKSLFARIIQSFTSVIPAV